MKRLLKVTLWTLPLGVVVGSGCALFLWMLELATEECLEKPWLLYLLPLAGIVMVLAYHHWGKGSEGGNNLILEEIHEPGLGVPRRMAPFVVLSTVVTHLFGGSAGREGTAIQMGGSLAAGWGRILGFNAADQRTLLLAGMAAGFGAIFGTPLTGAVFALEVLTYGRLEWRSSLPCLAASYIANSACLFWGIHHASYAIDSFDFSTGLLFKIALASVAFGLAGLLFAEMNHHLGAWLKKHISQIWLRPVLGALGLMLMVWLLGSREYLGLGLPGIANAFNPGGSAPFAWLWKTMATTLTLASGFKGGEVTPLFFVGSTLGNQLASLLSAPVSLMAGLGFVAVFSGATNTPLACTIMGAELFGWHYVAYLGVACYVAWACSGRKGIYSSQR